MPSGGAPQLGGMFAGGFPALKKRDVSGSVPSAAPAKKITSGPIPNAANGGGGPKKGPGMPSPGNGGPKKLSGGGAAKAAPPNPVVQKQAPPPSPVVAQKAPPPQPAAARSPPPQPQAKATPAKASPPPPPPGGGGGGGEQVIAIYDYAAAKPTDLALKKGDIISVSEKKPSGWWAGTCVGGSSPGSSGLFPGNYVQALKRVRAKYAYQARKADELSYAKGDVINVRKQGQNWWIGELNGNVGAFAITYVDEL